MPYKYNPYANKARCLTCKETDFCLAWNSFVEKQSDPENRSSYAHFDNRRYLNDSRILKKVMNPDYIKSHGFYPLIQYKDISVKYTESDKGKEKLPPKTRKIAYCGYLDRAIYQRYSFILNYHYNNKIDEMGIDDTPIAYRTNLKRKNNIHFAKEAFDFILNQEKSYILVGDFTGFFDSLNHEYLKKMLCKVLDVNYLQEDMYAIFKNVTRYSFWEWDDLLQINRLVHSKRATSKMNQKPRIISRKQFRENSHGIKTNSETNEYGTDCGIPQGTPVSAVLSNVYMLDFDRIVNNFVENLSGKYMRYSDDFIIIIPQTSKEEIIKLREFIFDLIKTIDKETDKSTGLAINEGKTQEFLFDGTYIRDVKNQEIRYLDYLGFIFNGKKIKVRRKAITKYYYRMYKKAKTIRESNGFTRKGNPISKKKLYDTYSERGKRTFIHYLKDADDILGLDDPQARSLIDNNMEKIANAIKRQPK